MGDCRYNAVHLFLWVYLFHCSCLALSCSNLLQISVKSVCVSVDSGLPDSPWGPGKKGEMDGHKVEMEGMKEEMEAEREGRMDGGERS